MFQTKVVEKIKRHFVFNNLFEYHAVYEITWKDTVSRIGRRRQYGACALLAEYLRLETHP